MSVESRLDELTVYDNAEERCYEARIGTKRVHASGAASRLRLVHDEGRAMSLVRDALADTADCADAVDAT
jgi:hypothetical protein